MKPTLKPPSSVAVRCPKCGHTLTIRDPGKTLALACGACGSILDTKHPQYQVISNYQAKLKPTPLIPLGARGSHKGETFECLGFILREIVVEGTPYRWHEYRLWNPYRGVRWLSYYGGHWTWLGPAAGLPSGIGNEVKYLDRTYKRFQDAMANVVYVLGEFDWVVTYGEAAEMTDYVSPPYLLSREKSGREIHWTAGEYLDGDQVWAAFKLPGAPPLVVGIAPAQPSPFDALAKPMHRLALIFTLAILLIQMMACGFSANTPVHSQAFALGAKDAEKSVVTQSFDVRGRSSNLEIRFDTNLSNEWAHFQCALVNETTGTAYDFSRSMEYYSGYDDGAWSEGGNAETVTLPTIPPGRYFLRIEPETDSRAGLSYGVIVKRDVPATLPFFFAFLLLWPPYLWFLYRRRSFEYQRWLESDFPIGPVFPSGSNNEDDE